MPRRLRWRRMEASLDVPPAAPAVNARDVTRRYGEGESAEPKMLRKVLFPHPRPGPAGVLRDLQSLAVQTADAQGAVVTLTQVARGLRDPELLAACRRADEHVKRAAAWAESQVKHRAVHTLTVPT